MSTIAGGCLCGAVRYRIYGEPYHVTHCHCTSCRKVSGAAFLTLFTVRLAEVEWVGESLQIYHSSAAGERGFCPRCGSTLCYQNAASPDEIDIAAGSMDNPATLLPEHHTWWSEHLLWASPTVLAALPVHLRSRMDTLTVSTPPPTYGEDL